MFVITPVHIIHEARDLGRVTRSMIDKVKLSVRATPPKAVFTTGNVAGQSEKKIPQINNSNFHSFKWMKLVVFVSDQTFANLDV